MTQTNQAHNLQGQPGQPQPGTINPASAQGGQGEGQPNMTQVDATKNPGSVGTQQDQQGRTAGAADQRQGETAVAPSQQQGHPPGVTQGDKPDTKPSETQP